jgi:hypothetical protein
MSTTHLFTPMQHRRIAAYTLFRDATLETAPIPQ